VVLTEQIEAARDWTESERLTVATESYIDRTARCPIDDNEVEIVRTPVFLGDLIVARCPRCLRETRMIFPRV